MTQNATSAAQACIFCAIVSRQAEASVVHEDETAVVFMDLNPVTPGHLLVVPREHAVGLEDLDQATSAHVWSVGHDMARALRRSSMRCEGINILLCDGEVASQTVFHFHLHVIPRYAGDGWTLKAESPERERSLLDSDAQAIKDAIASTDLLVTSAQAAVGRDARPCRCQGGHPLMPPAARAQLPGLLVALTDTGGAFTVVQRVGGYRGYGGVNAPVRIAAQQAASAAAAGAADVPAGRGRQ